MRFVRQSRFTPTSSALALMALMASAPAFAETEIETLRRELAEQRTLIQQLMDKQASTTRIRRTAH